MGVVASFLGAREFGASFRLEPKTRGLEPPSSCSWRIQGVVASFRLEPVNRGLEPPSSWCWRIGKLVLPMNVFLIYIRNHLWFSPIWVST
jgi:hypothetical protein